MDATFCYRGRLAIVRWSFIALVVVVTDALTAVANAAPVSDTSIQYLYGNRFHESYIPSNAKQPAVDVTKNIINLSHVDTYKYGGNAFSIDFRTSNGSDPASNSTSGAQDVFAVFRSDLSLSKVSGREWKWGFIRDVVVTAGFDYGVKDTAFSPRLWRPKIGPKLEFDVPHGAWNVALVYQHELNHCGTCLPALGQQSDVNFGNYWGLESAWNVALGSTNWFFSGTLTYYGKKGNNGNTSPTVPETFLRAKLLYDIGALVNGAKHTVLAGAGYQYRHNQFGNSVTPVGYAFGGPGISVPGKDESVPMIIVEWHF